MEHRSFIPVTRLLAMLGDWLPAATADAGGPKYVALADAIGARIHDGEAAGGLRLPSERELAGRLGVSRGTVVSAYALLEERQLVERRRGSGTWVRPVVAPVTAADRRHGLWSLYRGPASGPDAQEPIDLAIGAPRDIPEVLIEGIGWAGSQLRGMRDHGYHAGGVMVARRAIADRYTRAGVPTEPEQIVVTSGAQSAVSLVGRLFLGQHAPVAIETPAYPGAIEAFQRAGGTLVPVARDIDGPRPEALAAALAARPTPLIYVVPDVHNPTGDVISLTRRRRLVAIAEEHDALLVEDATLTQLSYAPPPPSLLELAPPGRVLQVGSMSKELWGGLRVGWIRVHDPHLADRIARLQAADSFGTDVVTQLAVAWAIPRAAEVVAERRVALGQRMTLLRALLAEHLPSWTVHPPRGGGSLWARLPEEAAETLMALARRRGVSVVPGTACAVGDEFGDHLRLAAWAGEDELRIGVERLAAAWADVVGSPPAGAPSAARLRTWDAPDVVSP
ncbi:aminotransferase-like domain-containing protein [Patulibacter defluvii]|uniref:aminotransferase-like domain-containing protein n=1 Tax=Patulibacter defluvii TaxID=3095358 RepID=UPI002A74D2BB|nr:PLP-dependent aminotransferase family protein [Patulibacter sp. DM4]